MDIMKCISICEPYLSAILDGHKLIENRPRATHHRGRILFHATQPKEIWMNLAYGNPLITPFLRKKENLVHGAIRGVVDIFACERPMLAKAQMPDQEKWIMGPWCYLLRDIRVFETPIPYCGHQFIFNVPMVVVAEQLKKVGL